MSAQARVVDALAVSRSPHGWVWPAAWHRPYASAWAIWSKLCDVNAATSRSALTVLGGRGLFTSLFDTPPEAAWLLEAHSLSAAQRQAACLVTLGFDRQAVERSLLRYCLICVAAEYHTPCFQHRAVTHCPVHNIALVDCCPHCGKRIATSAERARAVPFGCSGCGRRLSWGSAARNLDSGELTAIAASSAALSASTPRTWARAGSLIAGRNPLEAGHATWWGGVDPFVRGSTWRPMQTTVFNDNTLALHALAWRALIKFVEDQVIEPSVRERVLVAADVLERRDRCAHIEPLRLDLWAIAALIARYGARSYLCARRLLSNGCRVDLYPLTPQASRIVEASASGNSIVFTAEVRAEYLRMVKLARGGRAGLLEEDLAAGAVHVHWHLRQEQSWHLQWRALSDRRFRRLYRARVRRSLAPEAGGDTAGGGSATSKSHSR